MKLQNLVLPALLMPIFVTAIAIVQPSIASTISVSSQRLKTTNIAQDTKSGDYYLVNGNKKFELGDFQGAMADYDRAISIEPNAQMFYYYRAKAKVKMGDNDEAINDCNRAISLYPKYAQVYHTRGNARSALNDRRGAIADWQEAARLYMQQGDMHNYQIVTSLFNPATPPQIDKVKLEAFTKELLHLADEFNKIMVSFSYDRSNGTKGLRCVGNGRVLEDRRLYIDEFIAQNMNLLTRGSADYKEVVTFQNSLIKLSNLAIEACDYQNKRPNFD